MAEPLIRLATAADAAAIAAIYAPYVTGTFVSFEEAAPTAEEMAKRMAGDGLGASSLAGRRGRRHDHGLRFVLGLPHAAGLSLDGRDGRLSRSASAGPRPRAGPDGAHARPAYPPGVHGGRGRHHLAQPGQRGLAREARLRAHAPLIAKPASSWAQWRTVQVFARDLAPRLTPPSEIRPFADVW